MYRSIRLCPNANLNKRKRNIAQIMTMELIIDDDSFQMKIIESHFNPNPYSSLKMLNQNKNTTSQMHLKLR